MLDYLTLQTSTEHPTFAGILFTVFLTFLLSSLIAFTYRITTKTVVVPYDYLQTVILIGLVSATVMQAVGDSLARGLGMMGAMAIIRFRTNLRQPRNMLFVFASLAAGIACGVFGFTIALVGTFSFCILAVALRYSPWSKANNSLGSLEFELPPVGEQYTQVQHILKRYCRDYTVLSYKFGLPKKIDPTQGGSKIGTMYRLTLKLHKDANRAQLWKELSHIDGLNAMTLTFDQIPEDL